MSFYKSVLTSGHKSLEALSHWTVIMCEADIDHYTHTGLTDVTESGCDRSVVIATLMLVMDSL